MQKFKDLTHESKEVEECLSRLEHPAKALDLSIIIPAFNERWRLPTTLIKAFDYFDTRKCSFEIVVVDDGSTDDTSTIVESFSRLRSELRLIRLAKNRGKGHAVQSGILNAHGKIILFADADGSTPFAEIERLEAALAQGADIAIGSRAIKSAETAVETQWYRKILGRIFNLTVNILLLPKIADTQCGFKLFTRDAATLVFSKQQCEKFAFDIEILYIARRANLKISEVAVNWQHAPGSKVNLAVDSLQMFLDVLRIKFRH